MQEKSIQLLVYGNDIGHTNVSIDYPGVSLSFVNRVENPNYLFLDIIISENAQPGIFQLAFSKHKKVIVTYDYKLLKRRDDSEFRKGFDTDDVIYLLMPDRFSNGNSGNDDMEGMLEKAKRTDPNGRHGGDIEGIENQLPYLHELGITALWVNPLLENNMPKYSYHGYAITDFYKVDPRYGTNEDYVNLVKDAHKHGIKVIMDMVFNHCGTGHWWNNDLPSQDWYNQWPEFTRSNYRGGTVTDPYVSDYDGNRMLKGWFDKTMADMNQQNEFLANYLIQNSIWWIEYADLDGIRMDTYPYSFKGFMAEWMKRIRKEYPDFNVVAESWLSDPALVSYWQEGANNRDGYKSYVTNVFDFPMMYAMGKAFNETDSWDDGIVKLYNVLGQDFLYGDPYGLVLFVDNHDGDRFYTKIDENLDNFKLAMAFMTTTRGIPQLYYGTEILMTGHEHDGHGFIREDFPGGWPDDENNAFTRDGRTDDQNEAFDYLSNLLNWRLEKDVIHYGKLKHFIPEKGIYVYFRYNDDESVMVILNNAKEARALQTERFNECMNSYTSGIDIITGRIIEELTTINIPAKSAMIIELNNF